MKLELKMILVMLGVAVVSGGLLAVVYGITYDIIEENSAKTRQEALAELLPEAAEFSEQMLVSGEDTSFIYHAYDSSGEKTGLVFTVTPKGFAGPIEIMVGLRMDTTVSEILITSMSETPGLGAGIVDTSFSNQYMGLSLDEIYLTKAGGKVEAITASTISSNAVTTGVREGVERYAPYLTLDPGQPPPSSDTSSSTLEKSQESEDEILKGTEETEETEESSAMKKILTQMGFIDEFKIIVYLEDGRIKRVEIPEESFSETQGYGHKCLSRSFLDLFTGLAAVEEVLEVEAITAATNTSDSIKVAVSRALTR